MFARLFAKTRSRRATFQGQAPHVPARSSGWSTSSDLFKRDPLRARTQHEGPSLRDRGREGGPTACEEFIAEQAFHADILACGHRRLGSRWNVLPRSACSPSYIEQFFNEASRLTRGRLARRESDRLRSPTFPPSFADRSHDGQRAPVLNEVRTVGVRARPCRRARQATGSAHRPWHPLFDPVVDLSLGAHAPAPSAGHQLIDPTDQAKGTRLLVYLEHHRGWSVRDWTDGTTCLDSSSSFRCPVKASRSPRWSAALDYLPATDEQRGETRPPRVPGLPTASRNERCSTRRYTVPSHVATVTKRTIGRADKTEQKVKERLSVRSSTGTTALRSRLRGRNKPKAARIIWQNARQRADDLTGAAGTAGRRTPVASECCRLNNR